MIKTESLRAALTAALPGLATSPEGLAMFVDRGRIVARAGGNPANPVAFEYRYTLNLVLADLQLHPSLVMLPVILWAATNQPDLLAGGREEAFRYEADVIDSQTIDLSIELELTEPVRLLPREDAGFDLEHLPEVDPLLPDDAALSNPAALLKQIWWRGQRIVPGPPLPGD